jgi:hypothetical protein
VKGFFVLRLCSVKSSAEAQGENSLILYRQNEMPETQCSLFPIDCTIPKLDVAGSNPVSRSIESIT